MMPTADVEYRLRLGRHDRRVKKLYAPHRRLWLYLVAALLACLIATYLSYSLHLISLRLAALGALALFPIGRLLKSTSRDFSRTRRIVEFYECGMQRFGKTWRGKGISGK